MRFRAPKEFSKNVKELGYSPTGSDQALLTSTIFPKSLTFAHRFCGGPSVARVISDTFLPDSSS